MMTWTSAYLLARLVFHARRPGVDKQMQDDDWFALATEAQAQIHRLLSGVVPDAVRQSPVKMTMVGAGEEYHFGEVGGVRIEPVGLVEIYESRDTRKGPMIPGAEWDTGRDRFIMGINSIRFANGEARTFADGPYAIFATPPGVIDADTDPSLPITVRPLLVPRTLYLWASRPGSIVDPEQYRAMFRDLWYGSPAEGDYGILGALQRQYKFQGAPALAEYGGDWWHFIDDGSWYPAR